MLGDGACDIVHGRKYGQGLFSPDFNCGSVQMKEVLFVVERLSCNAVAFLSI